MDADKTIRVRVTETSGFLTIKGRTTGISRPEYEYEIPYAEAKELLDKFNMAEVLKIRYKIIHNDKLWEVDEFLGENEGLILAEIELEKEDEEFAIPEWVAGEVTEDTRYLNSNLAINPYQNWNHEH